MPAELLSRNYSRAPRRLRARVVSLGTATVAASLALSGAAASAAPHHSDAAKAKLTIASAHGTITPGSLDKVTISTPGLKTGTHLSLQEQQGAHWKVLKQLKAPKTHKITEELRFPKAGRFVLRAATPVPKGGKATASKSAVVVVKTPPKPGGGSGIVVVQPAITTAYLASLESSDEPSGTFTVDGTTQPHSAAATWSDNPVALLGGKYRSLTAYIGLEDNSPSDSFADSEIFADGRSLWRDKNVTVGQLIPVNLDVTGVQRLVLSEDVNDNGATLIFGQALVSTAPSTSVADPNAPTVSFLRDRNITDGDTFDVIPDLTSIDGTPYFESAGLSCSYGESSITYDVGRAFTTLTGTLGPTDDADSSFSGSVTISGDGVPLYTGPFSVGNAMPLSLNVSGVLRVTITCDSSDPYSHTLAIGDARLLSSGS